MNKTLLYALVGLGIFVLSLVGSYVGSLLAVNSSNRVPSQQIQGQMPQQQGSIQQNQQQSQPQQGSFGGQQQGGMMQQQQPNGNTTR